MTIEVEEWYDGEGKLNLTISWDEHDPYESQFNDWTEQDFLTAIKNACEEELSVGEQQCTDYSERLHLTNKSKGDIS